MRHFIDPQGELCYYPGEVMTVDATLSHALELLKDITPLRQDCGSLCASACCKDEGEFGSLVWLLPGEEQVQMPWGSVSPAVMPVTQTQISAIYCVSPCDRQHRPFLCRIFPLSPFYSVKRGEWDVRMDRRAAPVCPLFRYGKAGLDPAFVDAARAAVRLLAQDPEWEARLKKLEAEEAAYRMEL